MKNLKQYIKPELVVIEMECGVLLAASDLKYSDESADMDLEVLGQRHRGTWGNLWE